MLGTIIRTCALLTYATSVLAQSVESVASMGQPRRVQPYVAPLAHRVAPDVWDARLALGAHRSITNPVIGLLGVTGEAYLRNRPDFGAGGRVMATSRALGLSAGADWNGQSTIEPVVSWQTAVRRGGILGGGTMVRLDWLPRGRDRFALGIHVPLWQPLAGRTRPRATVAEWPGGTTSAVPTFCPYRRRVSNSLCGRLAAISWNGTSGAIKQGPLPLEAERAMQEATRAAFMILAYTNLFSRDTARVRYGESYREAARSYERSIDRAFGIAARDAAVGAAAAERARSGLLDRVILPYDALFGQVKKHSGTIRPLTGAAQAHFEQWVRDSSAVPAAARTDVANVHARLMAIVEGVHAALMHEWRDSRLVWLPLQLALREEQYDEQAEVDALIERAVGRPFTDRNALTYLRSSDLPLEIARSIFAARDYHVLWTHDFTGQRDRTKELDEVAYTMVADVYLPALTAAVQRYDSAGRFPAYVIFIDEFFYARRNGRLWMSILENPLESDMKLPGRNSEREARLRERQRELRAAVAASRTLPAGTVKVHVSVLQPADFSFRSHRLLPPWPFIPDNIARDHRKLVFYDVNEAEPYRGGLMIMGVGVGEHYASATWEDRGYRVRGPAALEARRELRRVWERHGMRPSALPTPLRDMSPGTPSDSIPSYDYVGRAIQVHNATDFSHKHSSVARAMLYNLAPAGSVIVVPDPIWVSDTWAAMLAGAAARGAKVYVIAPSGKNNPNPQKPIAAAERDVMGRLLNIRSRLKDQLAEVGGELRVGMYASTTEITDVAGRIAEVREGLRRAPWILKVIPFDNATLATLDRAHVRMGADGPDATDIAKDETPRRPMLHQKTQLVARPGAIETLVRQPGWDEVLARAMQVQSQQTADFARQLGWVTPDVDSAAVRSMDARLRGYEQSLSEAERKAFSFYFSVGMQNMDPRGIMLDGEATLIVSGLQAAAGLVDLFYLMARTNWIETQAELDAFIPPHGWWTRLITALVRNAL